MLQFLRFTRADGSESAFSILKGRDVLKFFTIRILGLLALAYSTVFLAVAIPYEGAYFIGGLITSMFLVRVINYAIKYGRYRGGRIAVHPSSLEIASRDETLTVNADDITYLEVNVLGNMLVRTKYDSLSFPLMLLAPADRDALIALFQDMAPRRTEVYKKIWDFFDAVLVAFILAMHIRQFIVQAYFIPTGSMEDTLQVGDHLLVEKLTYGPIVPQMIGMKQQVHLDCIGMRKVQRGDIIIFRPPNDEEKDFIKRCIAVEGDEYHIKDGAVWINGARLDEPYTKGITSYRGFSDKKLEGIVPKGMVIAMGDNRENSYDSRGFGFLPVERIKGRAWVLYWNTRQITGFDFSRIGLIR